MGMPRYRDDPFDEAQINVDEYQIFKLVTRHGDLHTVSYRAVPQPPRWNHHFKALPDNVWRHPNSGPITVPKNVPISVGIRQKLAVRHSTIVYDVI